MTFDEWVVENYPFAVDDNRLRGYLQAGWDAGYNQGKQESTDECNTQSKSTAEV